MQSDLPSNPLSLSGSVSWKRLQNPNPPSPSPWGAPEAHLELWLFLQQFKLTWYGAAVILPSPSFLTHSHLITESGPGVPLHQETGTIAFWWPHSLGSTLCTWNNPIQQKHVSSLSLQVREWQIPDYRNHVLTWGLEAHSLWQMCQE